MKQTFYIADSGTLGGKFNVVSNQRKVFEDDFWTILEATLKDFTKEQPDKYGETLQLVKDTLKRGPITIGVKHFQIKTSRK